MAKTSRPSRSCCVTTFKVTADTYTQAVTPVKRGAQARVAKLIMADGSEPKAITPTLQQLIGPKRTLIRKGQFL
jgi:hypothetical protein